MTCNLNNFKNDLKTYLNQKCPEVEVRLVDEQEYSKGFMLQINENSTDKADFYEVSLVKYIKNEEFEQAKKNKEKLIQALKEFAPDKFIHDVDVQPCVILPDVNGRYSEANYSSVSYSCFFEK